MDLIITIITSSASLILGLFTFLKNPKGDSHRLLAFLSFIIAFWAISNYISLNPPDKESTLFWIRFTMPSGAFMGPTIYLLVRSFPNYRISMSKILFFAIWAIAFITSILALSPYMFTSVTFVNGFAHPQAGPAMVVFALNFLGFLGASFVNLIQKYRKAIGLEKVQLRYLLLGIILTFSLIAITNLIFVNVFKITYLVFLGPSFPMILIGSISYAIIKHRFLDIRLVAARAVAYSILITIIGGFYVAATFTLSSLLLRFTAQSNQLIIYIILTIIVALSFERLRQIIEKITDRFFFKGKYDSSQLLSELSHIMSANIELTPLSSEILTTLLTQMKITRGTFILLEGNFIYDIIAQGFDKKPNFSYTQLIPFLDLHEAIVFDELEEGSLKQVMRDLNLIVVRVLRVKDEIVGLLLLGEKASGEIYSDQDIKVFNILGPEVAVAIENAKSYDKIKKFNITLSEEIRRATFDLQKANSRLKELDQLKDDFVSVASHELRTPMTAIRSYAWMALNKPDISLSEKMKKYLSRTLISTERLINLVNDMLNVSRIEAGTIEIRPQAFDIQVLADEVMEEVKAKALEKMINLKVEKEKIPQVFADPDKVHQVLLNLVGNALKFTPADGLISLNFFTDGQTVEISVKDSGVGISKDDLSSLFKKFGRLDNSYAAAATSGGTGLGLYICKSLVELMKGKIWARSEGLGKGSTFTFSLPIATPAVLAQAEKFTRKAVGGEAKILEPVAI